MPESARRLLALAAVLPWLAVSSGECVQALVLGGFRTTARGSRRTVLEHGYRRVVVADAALLEAEVLERLLHDAGIPYSEFLELLSQAFPADGGAPHDTGVRRALDADGERTDVNVHHRRKKQAGH